MIKATRYLRYLSNYRTLPTLLVVILSLAVSTKVTAIPYMYKYE